jgi:predicted nuclease of predicted toxin-antitoxin system
MIIWIDAHFSPALASWLKESFGVDAYHVRDLGLRNSEDEEIFVAARKPMHVVITKDIDFIFLLDRLGPPPQLLWVTCGNTSNPHLKALLLKTLPHALELLAAGERLIEISDERA